MKKLTGPMHEEGLEMINRYSHLLKSEENRKTSDQQKIDGLVTRMAGILNM